ncbi:MAG: hypothetical protein MJ175_01345 [Clostridia bacterium]|nr:hypothetical protein [Clostridia bacterium]
MDIKEQITKAVAAIQADKTLLTSFKTDPVKVITKVLGVKLPDDVMNKIVEGVKAKITADDAKGMINAIGGLFGKK